MNKFLLSCMLMLFSTITGVVWAQSDLRFTASKAPSNNTWAENTHWYLINASIKDDYHYKGYLCSRNTNYPSGTYFHSTYGLLLNKADKPKTSYGLWCLVGDETSGYTFYNRGEGTSKVLGLKDGNFSLIDPTSSDASNYVTKFDYAASTNSSVNNHFASNRTALMRIGIMATATLVEINQATLQPGLMVQAIQLLMAMPIPLLKLTKMTLL